MSAAVSQWGGLLGFDDIAIGRRQAATRKVTAAEIDAFAQISGDLNPLHMDQEFASHSPFGQRVAHGILTAAVVSMVHTELTGPGFAYVGQELRFLGPVFVDDTITVEVTVVGKKEGKRILILDTMVRKQTGEAVLSGLSALKELRFQ
jgi:3-hydroxybutyryl-CoA dehydratase